MSITTSVLFCLLLSNIGFSRSLQIGDTVKQSLKSTSDKLKKDKQQIELKSNGEKSLLLSNKSLDKLLANQVSYYISGSENISFYKAQATYVSKDGKLNLESNFPMGKKGNSPWGILTIGAKANIENGVTSIFQKSSFNKDFGIIGAFKFLKKSVKISFVHNSPNKMDYYRDYLVSKISLEAKKEYETFLKAAGDFDNIDKINQSKTKKILREAVDKFYKLELEEGKKYHSSASNIWLGADWYLPLASSEYLISKDVSSLIEPTMKK